MNYYPHHIGDFNSATRSLSWLEKYAYRELLEMYYDSEAPIPNDMARIYFLLGADSDEKQTAVNTVLKHFFTMENINGMTMYTNSRCDAEIQHYQKKQANQIKAGKASAAARRTKGQQTLNKRQPTKNQQPTTRNQFKKPSLEECISHLAGKAKNPIETAHAFMNHFEASGWMIKGGVKMKSWKAALNGWVARGKTYEESRRNQSKSRSDKNDDALRELYS